MKDRNSDRAFTSMDQGSDSQRVLHNRSQILNQGFMGKTSHRVRSSTETVNPSRLIQDNSKVTPVNN